MTKTIITRQVDELGRIAIPAEIRKELGLITENDIKASFSLPDENGIITVDFKPTKSSVSIQTQIGYIFIPKKYNLRQCALDIWIEDGILKLKKISPQCILCGETTNLIRYKDTDKYISKNIICELSLLL